MATHLWNGQAEGAVWDEGVAPQTGVSAACCGVACEGEGNSEVLQWPATNRGLSLQVDKPLAQACQQQQHLTGLVVTTAALS